jgi:hypothetical protein
VINEQPVIDLLRFEAWNDNLGKWEAWTADLNSLSMSRGGKRNGPAVTVEPGLLSATLVNAGDPLEDPRLGPNTPVRVGVSRGGVFEPIFTGRISDIAMTYVLNKSTGTETTRVVVTATDAVTAHAATTRYGVQSDPETWAQRIRRLAESSLTEVVLPEDDGPVLRYEL